METVATIFSAVRSGGARAAEVLEEHRRRHRELHGRLNALIQPRPQAAQVAAAVDASAGGLLAGVPVSVKECFAVRGLLTTLGLESRTDEVDDHDAQIVVKLEAAGAVVVGKANVPQAMFLHETSNPLWGRTLHPLDPLRSPGGSSGGDAALVAAGVVPLGVGNDLAGSLRQPAHSCGISAILPRSEVLGQAGGFPTMPHLTVVQTRAGFLARHPRDLRHALAAVGGAHRGPRSVKGLRIGWWDDAGPIPAAPAIRRAVVEAAARLHAAGSELVQLDATLATEAAWLQLAILSADGASHIRALFGRSRPEPGLGRTLRLARLPKWLRWPLIRAAVAAGRQLEADSLAATGPLSHRGFERVLARRAVLAGRFAGLVAGCDALLCPVSALPALRHGTGAPLLLAAAPCMLANLLNLAAGAVPVTEVFPGEADQPRRSRDPVAAVAAECDRGSAGLPVGVQVIAVPGGDESLVLDLMDAIAGGR